MKYSIPESNMDKLTKRLVTIGNKCNKFGCTFSFEIIGEHYEKQFDDAHVYTGDIKYIDVEVSGKAIINNWVFVATLEHTDKGNIVRAYDGQEVPQWAYTVEAKCDHCKTKHTRKDTYIVRNTETGEFKQVGRSCLKDFTNGLSAEMVAAYLSYLDTLEKSSIDFSSSKPYYNVKEYLFYVAETVKHFGYLSKANAGYNGTPTSCRAFRYMVCPNAQERKEMESIGFEACTEENENTVVTALQWLNAQDDDFGYIHNLKIACSREYCESRDFGIIASLLPAHFKAMEKNLSVSHVKPQKPISQKQTGLVKLVSALKSLLTANVLLLGTVILALDIFTNSHLMMGILLLGRLGKPLMMVRLSLKVQSKHILSLMVRSKLS